MGTKEKNTLIHESLDTRLKILMSIRDFQKDFEFNAKEIEMTTQDLISVYERGLGFLNSYAEEDFKREADGLLNEVRVHANQMNHQLKKTADQIKEREEKKDFSANWKEFDQHKNDFRNSALKFERKGLNALPTDKKQEWENSYVLYEKITDPLIKTQSTFEKLILDFVSQYDKDELNKISRIVQENSSPEIDWSDPVEFKNQYIKAISEFQREFKPQNLWDSFLELLAGGVHPSPSERIMFEKWIDGEQKMREDM